LSAELLLKRKIIDENRLLKKILVKSICLFLVIRKNANMACSIMPSFILSQSGINDEVYQYFRTQDIFQ